MFPSDHHDLDSTIYISPNLNANGTTIAQRQGDEKPHSTESLFARLNTYPFGSDPEFKSGLALILGHPVTDEEFLRDRGLPDDDDDLVLRAKCFYFSRKNNLSPPLDFLAYKSWIMRKAALHSHPSVTLPQSQSQPPQQLLLTLSSPPEAKDSPGFDKKQNPHIAAFEAKSPSSMPGTTIPMQTPTASSTDPAYPSSFAHIVELITAGQPVPGIQEIPDTVLTGYEASGTAVRRRKPWEVENHKEYES